MACHLDHSKLQGLRFCTACGQPLTPGMNTPATAPQQAAPAPGFAPPPPTPVSFQQNFSAPIAPKNNNALIFSISGATLALVLIGGLFFVTKSPEPVSVDVSLTLLDEQCFDISWGYFDIPGGDIELEVDGVTTGYASFPSYGNTTYLGCEFAATFYDIPADASVYSYSLGNGRRGVITKSREELEADDWSFRLSIG